MDKLWLPTGDHWGLHITHHPRLDAGAFVDAEPKTLWHTVEGTGFDGAMSTLIGNGDEPHFLVSNDARQVVQFIALNRASKSLRHPAGTPETNRAHCIQIEVCGFAAQSGNWPRAKYLRLASLAALIEHRTGVERASRVSFQHPRRVTAAGFARKRGHLGHMHVPNNDHVDPGTGFHIGVLLDGIATQERKYQ